jgi:hypothetical protein
MTSAERKEAYKLFWMVKGHLNTDESTILASAEGYFKRMWCNNEAYLHAEGFEEAFKEMLDNENKK